MVTCLFCGSVVTRSGEVVQAAAFHEAWLRAQAGLEPADRYLELDDRRYRVLAQIGAGETADVYLAERMSVLPERVVIKLVRATSSAGVLKAEGEVLRALQRVQVPGAAYFSQRLPQVVAAGAGRLNAGSLREALILRALPGYWGSMAESLHFHSSGIDPRHAVWIWRRVLEVLGFVHGCGWAHGDLHAGHWLVQPRDHGILLIGWRAARQRADQAAIARDLMQSAWVVRQLLRGGTEEPGLGGATPAGLSVLLCQASEDAAWCARLGAMGIDELLRKAAREAFGSPRFIPFNPTAD